jgi:DHA1 family bicyclomycin/chloramphenicol resistance-like MFS transporter
MTRPSALPSRQPAVRRRLDPASTGFIVLLALATAMQAIGTTFTVPALPVLAQAFATTPDIVQLTLSGYLGGLASGQILFGALSDRFGRRPVLLFGLGLFTLAGAVCALAGSVQMLVAARAVQGFAGGAGMILGRAIIRDVFEREQALKAMSVMVGVMTMLPMISPLLGGLVLEFAAWRWVFGVLSLISGTLTIAVWLLIGESLRKPDPTATRPRRILANCLEIVRKPEAISFPVITALIFGGMFAFMAIVPFIAIDSFGLTAAQGGWLVGVTGLALWSGALFNNRKAGRWPVRRLLRLSTGTALAASLAALASTAAAAAGWLHGTAGLVLVVLPCVAYAFTFGISQPNCIVMGMHPVPHIAGTASALGSTLQMGTAGVLTWLVGYLYNGTPVALGIVLAGTAVVSFLVFRLVAQKYTPAQLAQR